MRNLDRIEELGRIVIDCGYRLHRNLGPGLLESAYELILFESPRQRGVPVRRQVPVPISWDGIVIDNAFKVDILVEDVLLIELKSTERVAAVHAKQVLTYLRLMGLPLGFLMNFGQATFKEGLKRVANDYYGVIPTS
ncbi:GxxExxY protein [Altererythrobacter aerius]|uniref:GxxExxY protein n=1 Tax=Tsuneonella aeria TaxID=1837929 RepID=A0A6I4T8Y8_9SPHN|nr:GxxExxY protein [Tsuneonella aeria]MXO73672.1 GxxExxY protein [Tsuneonella aeria]